MSICQGLNRSKLSCYSRIRDGFHTCWLHRGQENAVIARAATAAASEQGRLALEAAAAAANERIILCDDIRVPQNDADEIKTRLDVDEIDYLTDTDQYVLYGLRVYDKNKKYHILFVASSPEIAKSAARDHAYAQWYAEALYPPQDSETDS